MPLALSAPPEGAALRRLRVEHDGLRRALADLCLVAAALADLDLDARQELLRASAGLCVRLERHARVEEREVYPRIAGLEGELRLAEAMIYDHAAIEAAAVELAGAEPRDDSRVQGLVYGLHALVITHIEKEETIIFPMLEPRRS